jgi:hypothetical protein
MKASASTTIPLGAPLVRRGGGSGAADGTVRAAVFRRVELLSKVCVGVREEVLRENPSRLSAPVHAPELVHVEIAGARATLEGRFAGLDHLSPVSKGLVRTVANPALRFVVRGQFLVRQPQLPVIVMNQQNARREDRQPVVHTWTYNFDRAADMIRSLETTYWLGDSADPFG